MRERKIFTLDQKTVSMLQEMSRFGNVPMSRLLDLCVEQQHQKMFKKYKTKR